MNIKNVILSPYTFISTYCYYRRNFNHDIAKYKSLELITKRWRDKGFSKWVSNKRHQAVLSYLQAKYQKDIDEIIRVLRLRNMQQPESSYIWQAWWQGVQGLAGITKVCTNATKLHAKNSQVVLITKENYLEYVSLPSYILEKVDRGLITLTELSDILRSTILYNHGGLWIDTTMLPTQDLLADVINKKYYTCKEACKDSEYVSYYRWCTSCIGGYKWNPLFGFTSMMFMKYWEIETDLVDYYLLDYFMALAYNNMSEVKEMVDSFPYNNPENHTLETYMDKPFDSAIWHKLTERTVFFKLSRKRQYKMQTPNEQVTFAGYVFNEYN